MGGHAIRRRRECREVWSGSSWTSTFPRRMRVDAALGAAGQRDQRAIATFHLESGRRLFEQGRDEEAIAELRRTIFLSPYESEAHLLLGRIYLTYRPPARSHRRADHRSVEQSRQPRSEAPARQRSVAGRPAGTQSSVRHADAARLSLRPMMGIGRFPKGRPPSRVAPRRVSPEPCGGGRRSTAVLNCAPFNPCRMRDFTRSS